MIKTLKVKLIGVGAVLQHNVRLANPLNEYTRAISKISKKRNKSEEEIRELSRLEFLGGICLDDKGNPVIPATWIEAAVKEGARKQKLGKQATAGVSVLDNAPMVKFTGPKDVDKRAVNPDCMLMCSVGIGKKRIMRTRPLFDGWTAEASIQIDSDVIDDDNVLEALSSAGKTIGIGDYRPRYGRFSVEVVK